MAELNKNLFPAVFILFMIVFAVHPAFSRGRLKLKNEKQLRNNSEIYEIDYKGPETHSYSPTPPNYRSSSSSSSSAGRRRNSNGGPVLNPKMHDYAPSKRPSAADHDNNNLN